MSNNTKARVIAFYLPQFHPIPENDLWWRKGFTEWMNVGKARKLYLGHYQPRVPADLGYYDLRVAETREAQAQMAAEYGVEGFCYWHYWFGNGKRLLERPFNEVLAYGQPDFPFCLAWANESWRGFYHGIKTKTTFIDQIYAGDEDYIAHFQAVLPAFKDKRYITVDGKPLFMIYQPFDNKDSVFRLMELWQHLAKENGLKGIHFVAQSFHLDRERAELEKMGFDAINTVRLFDYEKKYKQLRLFSKFVHWLCRIPFVVPYNKVCKCFITKAETEENIYPTIFPNWDHTPRSGTRGLVLHASTPENFEKCVVEAVQAVTDKEEEHKLVFIKSWNEWAEGNYLEPDLKYGLGYLEALLRHVK